MTTRLWVWVLVLVAAATGVASACDADPEPDEAARTPPVQRLDSAGVEIVLSGAEGVWAGPPRSVDEVLRIGVVEGDEPYQLFQVRDVAVDPEGRIYVANGMTATIRIFDPNGRLVRELGGRGQGPGEFTDATRIHLADTGFWVEDIQQLRVTGFDFLGRVQDTWTFIHDGVISLPHRTPQGWLGRAYRGDRPRPQRPPVGTPHTSRVFLDRVVPATDPDAEATSEPVVELPPWILYATYHGTRWDWPLFQPRAYTGVDAVGRIYLSRGTPYEVDVFSPQGELLRRIRRDITPVPIGPETVSELIGHAREFYLGDEFTGPEESARRGLEQYVERVEWQADLPTLSHVPPAGRLLVSPDGSFWLERTDDAPPAWLEFERTFPAASRMGAGRRLTLWDVFDDEALSLGQVHLPRGFAPHRVRGLVVYGVERDEMGVEYVVVYRIASD